MKRKTISLYITTHLLIFAILMMLICTALSAPFLAAGSAGKTLSVSPASDAVTMKDHTIVVSQTKSSFYLRASYGSKNVTSKATWHSSKKSVATVSAKGKVTVKKKGRAVITCTYKKKSVEITINAKQAVLANGVPSSKEAFIQAVAKVAQELYPTTGILPSVVIAQCCLETGYGLGSDAAILVKKNNLLGMKAALLNSSWSDSTVWNGKTVSKVTPEYINGQLIYITDTFRAYPDYRTCILDYEMFLLNVKYNGKYKYRSIRWKTSPKKVITTISRNGYATDPSYITKVMQIIRANKLTQYDS